MPAKMLNAIRASNLEDELGLESPLARAALKAMLENLVVLDQKQMDYGPENLLKHGTFGVVVRMGDKMSRIDHLFKKRAAAGANGLVGQPLNESIADSFKDMANYAIIAYLMEVKAWPVAPSNFPDEP